jgi:uncharacterized membrane protein
MTTLFTHTGEMEFSDDDSAHRYHQAVFWHCLSLWFGCRQSGTKTDFIKFLHLNYWKIRREIFLNMTKKHYVITTEKGHIVITDDVEIGVRVEI